MGEQINLLQGTLEVLILKAVSLGPLHGYGILLRIGQISGDRIQIPQGSFYVALYRLEHKGLLRGKWGESENNRRAKFYSLTAAGVRQLRVDTDRWDLMTAAVSSVLTAKAEHP